MVDALSDRQARVEQALNERLQRTSRGIPERNRGVPTPLSSVQQALWLTWKLDGGSATSRPSALRLRGRLDLVALEWALSEMQQRHEVMRSTFPEVDGAPTQVPQDVDPIVLQLVDLSRLPADQRESEASRVAGSLGEAPFDLEREAPFRPHLIRIDARDHVLVMALDHIVMDGWSERVLHHEIRSLYDARLSGEGAERLAPLPIQYGDFAAWQMGRLTDDALGQQLAYWRHELAELPDDLELPADPDAVAAATPEPVSLDLPPQLVADLAVFGRTLQATPFMVLLAGLDVLLAHHGRTEELVIGVSTAGRIRPELEGLLGCFINTLPIRAHVGAEATFRDMVAQARDRLIAGLDNQDLPYSRLVAEFRPWGSAEHRPLFQVSFQMRNFPEFETPLRPELEVVDYPLPAGPMDHQLAIRAVEVGDNIALHIDFDCRRFLPSSIEGWAGELRDLLAAAVLNPDRPLRELPLLHAEPRPPMTELDEPALTLAPAEVPTPVVRSALVRAVAEVWAEVLELDEVPDDAGFFEMGGHSLLAIRVMARLRDRLGVDLALIELFTNPTLEAFAGVVGEHIDGAIPERDAPLAVAEAPPIPIPTADDELDALLAELQLLSDDEAVALLAELDSDAEVV